MSRLPPKRELRLPRAALFALLGLAAAACAQPRDAGGVPHECETRLIVGLDRAPDDALLASLSRTADARLELVRALPANLYLLTLAADASCEAAVERLRADARVRSVDVDERRRIEHGPRAAGSHGN